MKFMMNYFFLSLMIYMFFFMMLIMIMSSILMSYSIVLDFEIMTFMNNSFNFILFFDFFSTIFFFTVMLISLSVFMFSSSYMKNDKYYKRFHYLLLSFVVSMVMLILSPNLISILLGWDGLGISSYLLVIYYSNSKSYNAGMITVLSNRVGDTLIIICFSSLMFLNNLNIFMMFYMINVNYFWIFILLMIAGCTKSAQIPFSAWLPAAMAAPTPVSSLVHSSTLVTAGVYLIFRFDNLLILLNINNLLMILGGLTMFMASLSAFFEMDMKKMVALSTLSQLGVMLTALGAGFKVLGFFHLISHAFFKALLFVSSGNLIHSSESYQDLRVMGGNSEIMILSKSIVISSSFSLCGLPFMSAFYSKEMIIESLLIYNLSIYIYFIMVLGVFMTVFYSMRFLILSLTWINRQRSLFSKSDLDFTVNFSMMILLIPAVSMGAFISQKLSFSYSFMLVSSNLKYFMLMMIILGALLFYYFNFNKIIMFNKFTWGVSNLWGLTFLSSRTPIYMSMNLGDFLHKMVDFSWVYFIFTNFMLNNFKVQTIWGLSFMSMNFIRIMNNMFFMLFIFFFLIY